MTQQPEAHQLADVLETHTGTLLIYRQQAAAELRRLHEEVQEQARCNGMGAERELALRGRITTLESALQQALEALESVYGKGKRCEAAITTAKQTLGDKT